MSYFFDSKNTEQMPKGRVEGIAKVTGKAKYSAEYEISNVAYGVVVGSTIASGRILKMQVEEAMKAPGVIDILSHENKPYVSGFSGMKEMPDNRFGLPIFYTDKIYYNDQPIAMVVAETIEDAMFAAPLVKAEYEEAIPETDFAKKAREVPLKETENDRGSVGAWEDAPHQVDQEYTIAMEVHNPMEMHATIAQWKSNDKLLLYDKNQGVNRVQSVISSLFDIPTDNIHVISEFVGGGFGSGLRVWPHTIAAVMAAQQIKRPVKVMLTRPQMFTMVGYRPESWQRVKLGADKVGNFKGIIHQAKNDSSKIQGFSDGITRVTRKIYGFKNVKTEEAIVGLNVPMPTWNRGPGDTTGCFGVESAIDELCHELKLDPVEVRLKNIAPYEMETGLPWSTNYLNECMEKGAELIGWKNRNPVPGSLKEGGYKIGYGVAVGMWSSGRSYTGASIDMKKDGVITVRTAMTDIGTGTGTGMQNVAHTVTGIPKNKIKIELGNSDFPKAPSQGGSRGMASVSSAVYAASLALKRKLAGYAWPEKDANALNVDNISLSDNGIIYQGNQDTFVSYADIFGKNNLNDLKVEEFAGPGEERKKYGFCSSAAHFYKVKVHERTGKIKVDRMVIVVDAGRIINPKAAANQVIGAGAGGIGMGLLEEQLIDFKTGRLIGNDLAGYHFAVNADVPLIEVSFIGKPDPNINPSGAKGLGEVGIIGAAPAIANAVFNATGKRVRDLPITVERFFNA
jgi:xanthine dehydrogenase YagR molybdenum-binding subunit